MSAAGTPVAIVAAGTEETSFLPVQEVLRGLASRGWNANALYAGAARNGKPQSRWRSRGPHFHVGLLELKPRLVHFLSMSCALIGMRAAQAMGASVIVTLDGEELALSANGLWDQIDALHLPESGLVPLAQRLGCPQRKVVAVIPPAASRSCFASAPDAPVARAKHDAALRILSVGALRWDAGFEDSLAAVKLLVDRGVSCGYRIVGDGDYAPALAFARDQLGLDAVAEFLPPDGQEALSREMAGADVYLAPGLVDGGGAPIVQAQAMGLPVVATAGRDLRRDLVEEGAGFVVSRRDPRGLADKLQLLADKTLRRSMGDAARAVAWARFTAEQHVLRLDDLYRRTMDGKAAP